MVKRCLQGAFGAVLLCCAFAGQAGAATTLGEVFEPTNNYGGDGMFIQSASPGGKYAAPTDGVITAWSFQAGAIEAPPMSLKMMRAAGGDQYTVVGTSRLESPALNTVNTWPTRIPVKAGDFLGVYYSDTTLGFRDPAPGFESREFVNGEVPTGSTDSFVDPDDNQLDLAATLEADADRDGFGDESQDGCPTNPASQAPCPVKPPACPAGSSPGVTCQTVAGVTTIRGTAGSDRIVGTPGRDVVLCGDGADTVTTGAGNDEVRCGAGADRIDSGLGNDLVLGELGNDRLVGGPGTDRLNGGDDQDRLGGGSGKDTASGGNGRDIVGGGSGNDQLNGNAGADRVSGDSGNDSVKGSSGNDRLFGGSGKDRLSGGSGKDRLAGGTGRDRLSGGPGADKTKQ